MVKGIQEQWVSRNYSRVKRVLGRKGANNFLTLKYVS